MCGKYLLAVIIYFVSFGNQLTDILTKSLKWSCCNKHVSWYICSSL